MKLVKLLPEQVMRFWDQIEECIRVSLPPMLEESNENILRIQESLLVERMQCWLGVEDLLETTIYGIMTTSFCYDDCTGQKNLLIFSLTIVNAYPETLWKDSYETLRKFAAFHECKQIIAYTNLDSVAMIVRNLGGDDSWKMLKLPV